MCVRARLRGRIYREREFVSYWPIDKASSAAAQRRRFNDTFILTKLTIVLIRARYDDVSMCVYVYTSARAYNNL